MIARMRRRIILFGGTMFEGLMLYRGLSDMFGVLASDLLGHE